MFFSWLRGLARRRAQVPERSVKARALLQVECLEERAVPAATPLTLNQAFVTQVYQDVLGRAPDAGGLAGFTNALDQGALTRLQVAQIIETSPEHLIDIVQNDYLQLLRRPADPLGLQGFVNFLQQGGTDQQLQGIILGSNEYFITQGGGTNTGFLQAVYRDILHRDIDPSGLQSWSQALANGLSRTQVATFIATSPEANAIEVQNLFTQLLGRTADAATVQAFANQLQINQAANNGSAAASASGSNQMNLGNNGSNNGSTNASASAEAGLTNEQEAALILSSPEFLSRLTV